MKTLMSTLICGITLVAVSWGQASREKLPGSDPYTPTKLEWLAVELNSGYRLNGGSGSYFISRSFQVDHRTDTVVVSVRYQRRRRSSTNQRRGRSGECNGRCLRKSSRLELGSRERKGGAHEAMSR